MKVRKIIGNVLFFLGVLTVFITVPVHKENYNILNYVDKLNNEFFMELMLSSPQFVEGIVLIILSFAIAIIYLFSLLFELWHLKFITLIAASLLWLAIFVGIFIWSMPPSFYNWSLYLFTFPLYLVGLILLFIDLFKTRPNRKISQYNAPIEEIKVNSPSKDKDVSENNDFDDYDEDGELL